MPNDNTHTLLPCPFCGGEPIIKSRSGSDYGVTDYWAECRSCFACSHVVANHQYISGVRGKENGYYPVDHVEGIQSLWNTRTPAEPKAGDWDAVLLDTLLYSQGHGIKTPPHEDPSDILDEYEKSIPDGAYRESIRSIRRALSSAAPRITEEMVERLQRYDHKRNTHEQWIGRDDEGRFVAFEDVLALLRQQGAERKWISVDERLPEDGQPIWIRFEDGMMLRVLYVSTLGDPGFFHWCEWRIDTPPPFTPTRESR